MSERERERKSFWTHADGRVRYAEGLDCGPNCPDAWYFPALGFSTSESALFLDRQAAVDKAREWIYAQRLHLRELEKALDAPPQT
jgi:hypothetical protein